MHTAIASTQTSQIHILLVCHYTWRKNKWYSSWHVLMNRIYLLKGSSINVFYHHRLFSSLEFKMLNGLFIHINTLKKEWKKNNEVLLKVSIPNCIPTLLHHNAYPIFILEPNSRVVIQHLFMWYKTHKSRIIIINLGFEIRKEFT